jgi:flagellar hook assembly protein FlgD
MNTIFRKFASFALLCALMCTPAVAVSTPGSLSLNATVNNYTGKSSSTQHWTVVWVTNPTTGLVRTLRRQGPGYASHWNSHCSTWYAAVAADTTKYTVALDGYTSGTASNYTSGNGTVSGGGTFVQTWNCKDSAGVTVPDGTYNIFIQYAEDAGQGPVTTALTWVKGPTPNNPVATSFASQGTTGVVAPATNNFSGLSATWTPDAPEIAVEQPSGTNLTDGSANISCGSVNLGNSSGSFTFTVKNTGTLALTLTNPVGKDGTNAADFVVSPIATSVAAGGSTTFSVTFTPGAAGTRTAAIHIASNDADENPFDITLSGTGVLAPEIAVEQPAGTNLTDGSATVDYGSVSLGNNLVKTFTVKNTGTAGLTLTNPVSKDGTNATDFAVSSIATSVAEGGSTTFNVTFTPSAAGTRTAAIHIASNDGNENPFDINLTGAGGAVPEIAVEQPAGTNLSDGTATIDCGAANVGSATSPITFTVKNSGSAGLTLTNPVGKDGTHAADFAVSAIASSVATGGSTTFTVTFTPGAGGSRTAAIHITSNDSDETPFDINLTGTGLVPEIAVEQPPATDLIDSAATISCGTANLGQSSGAFIVTVRNPGTADLTGLVVTKSGSHAADFAVGALGSTTLTPGSSTTFNVTFAPTAVGTRTASVQIASNDSDENPFDINLAGTGENPIYTLGSANLKATLHDFTVTDYPLENTATHMAVAWVTKADGTFIKTLWKQGPAEFDDGKLADHFTTWNTARGGQLTGSTVIDGYTSPTATTYSSPNNPVDLTWNCRDAANNVVPDGNYKFWIQYSERMTPGVEAPVSTLLWTKGTSSFSSTYANSGAVGSPEGGSNYTTQSVAWMPLATPGTMNFTAMLHDFTVTDYPAENDATHMTIAWVTKADGTFIKTLWKQGPVDFNDTRLNEHFSTWNTARAGSTVLDGFTGPTATTYSTPDSPIDLVWNCRDASNNVVPDGDYKLWIQYTERMNAGVEAPVSTLLWTKGAGGFANTYANSGTIGSPAGGSNYTAQSVIWTPQATAGTVSVKATLSDFTVTDYVPNDATHFAVAWVTKGDGTFIKTLWKQGPVDFADSKFEDHFRAWSAARKGSTALDGFSGATATTYSVPNSPLEITWNCKDADNNLMPDGDYKFWIQYTERMIAGVDAPVTGMIWTKGPVPFSASYTAEGNTGAPAGGTNFSDQSVSWSVATPFDSWIAGQVPVGQTGPLQTPQDDGVTNLEKFAFNMNPSAPDVRMLTVGGSGTAGLPGGALVGGKLRIEFVRRKAATNPGITYTPQFCSGLGIWDDFTGAPVSVTSIDPTWERVVVDDPVGAAGRRFGRVKLVQP